MKKRTICLLLAMIMVLSIVLAGCSKTAETPAADETPATTEPAETTDNTETPEAPEETAEPALEQKTIQLMITGAGKQANSDKVWAAFNEQLQQYVPNTTVEFIDVSFDEYSEKFSQVLASGEGVDLAWTGWLINKPQNIADGNLMPLDDLLAEYGQGIVDILGENVVEIHRNAADGKLYYLPSWQGLCGERRGWLVVTEIAELAGDTWIEDTEAALNKWRNNYSGIEDFQAVLDQATKYLAAAKEAGKLGAGINTGRAFGWSMYNGMYSFLGVGGAEIGITYCDDTFTVKDGVAGEHYKLYAKTMADWYKEGYIRSDTQYGKCVFKCDNDVVDHQVVNMEFADKSTASFTMSCFNYNGRKSNIMGTKGEMFLDFEGDEIRIFHFEGRWWETIHTNGRVDGTLVGGHGGGDPGIVNALYDYMTGAKTADEVSEIGISCENTRLVFAAERSRLNGDVETITPLE